jgi:hypothetical protein
MGVKAFRITVEVTKVYVIDTDVNELGFEEEDETIASIREVLKDDAESYVENVVMDHDGMETDTYYKVTKVSKIPA